LSGGIPERVPVSPFVQDEPSGVCPQPMFERNHNRKSIGADAVKAFELVAKADAAMMPSARTAWRWRIVYRTPSCKQRGRVMRERRPGRTGIR
jgi:hypothetical protein